MGVFKMPSLGADMDDGKLIEWLVAPGDTVTRGDVVAVVETQKGAIEIEIFEDGVVERIDAALGGTFPVGAPLAVIRGAGAPQDVAASPQPAPAPKVKPAPPIPAPPSVAAKSGDFRASPAARARAAELGIDLSNVSGTGPEAAIVLADVDRAAPGSRKPAKQGLDLDAMRTAIAAAMTRSKHEIPHYYLEHEIDLQTADDWLRARNADRPPEGRILMGTLFVKAMALAAAKVTGMNGQYVDGVFQSSQTVNAGVAVALRGGGLIAPALMDAAALPLDQVMAAMRDLVKRARTGRLKGSEMTDGTITLSSLGETGVDGMTAVIYPPQVAIVAFGTPRPVPRVVDGAVLARLCAHVTLAADHRVSDGRRGAKFLKEIDTLLQSPEDL
ncbi:Dihydrolipoyllysine-residue acetyltransferase component of pyruvate dehydrogenase complex [Thalassovita gelatinovora]|uniref:Dihydrolipoamide acetyltransferase component of pyruvate dehydrogenase complex n=1 Tax=Thalassovita gelatinovora TaxID=53501 RepID=A0A0P1FHT1_THAGE|nr:dihydrolipoamide acetyltransferase family protein [Thalassovita gelatinovora]QIZ82046.1 2-oxo acid dehydrogenase subunit E2 [Thalassovita gelatinovora]CUH67541.1 Dihydrolipoyllysine-residue acetyltransferase component of pyruvate dehydrogenase complex [Thalassovita gelatinovora]SEP72142.1 pyruvate dehydrogenase E2 component (dihydrolipoamide acetyltransferase) [Thalassovita gelatinovora]